ncbi:hypothetical protein vBRpoSV10_117 [Ruegeria phage vB_RpoS-V10]|nr:hypothetical protein vBRpoSV10_117 [Ruegeria phage vB_RpoS-V10]
MNAIELLDYIFSGIGEEFAVFAADHEILLSVDNLPPHLDPAVATVELMLVGSRKVVGVPIDDAAMATIRLMKGDEVVNVALFEAPVDESLIPEFVETFEIPIQNGWEAEIATGTFYLFDEVFGMSDSVTENDIEVEHAEDAVADPVPDRELVDGDEGEVDVLPEQAVDVSDDEDGGAVPDQDSGAVAPQFLNDAELLGTPSPALDEFLNRPTTFMLGEMWGQRDKRNTQDNQWKATEMPLINWIFGGPGDKNTSAWGLSRHPVGKDKEGACIVLGSSVGKARKAKSMEYMHAIGLDVDSGARLNDVLDTVVSKGLFCLVYTSFNHGKRGLQLKRDEVMRKLQIKTDPDLDQIKMYLREHDKNRYEESFIAGVSIKSAKEQVKDGVVIILDTPPLEKFRLFFPLEEPVKIIDLAATHEGALSVWEDAITGMAVNNLGIHFDTSCTDPSRLFYTARHPKDAEDFYCAIVQGKPLRFEDIEPYKKSLYTAKREKLNAFEMAGNEIATDKAPQAVAPSGMSLNDWHRGCKDRFLLANLLEDYCPDRIRTSGGEAAGHVHTECPFEHEHTSEGGTGTMAINCIDSQNDYWTWFCHHDACQGRHKLQFVEEALRQGWFEESMLTDMSFGYLLEGPEEEADHEEVAEEESDTAFEGTVVKTVEELAAEFTPESSQEDIQKFIKKLFRQGVDMTVRANVTAIISGNTNLGKREVKLLWKELEDEQRRKDKEREKAGKTEGVGAAIVNEWDFDEVYGYAQRRIHDTNHVTPTIFHYMETLCVIRENSEGHARMRFLDKDGFAHHVNKVARFVRTSGEGDKSQGVSCPYDVVTHLFSSDYSTYPDLRGVVTTPTFTKKGSLLTTPGYDYESKLYYHPDIALSVPSVAMKPTEENLYEAKRLIIEEVLADFPLGALTRREIIEQALDGEGVPAVTNMMACLLLPFMREMVDGPTPGHLLVKPAPGTGASLLTDTFSIIATGQVTPALAMPTSKDEMSKTLTSVLANGQNIVFFDNINHSVDSGELASAMTTPTYQARILGKSQTIEVDVRCAWIFTGNNVTLSSELVRRLIMIDLDAQVANPELREGWRHDDIRGWAKEHRGELVWACLTIIQNWVAQGMVHQKDSVLASYENWSGVVGGVLKAAGMGGFMKNRDALKASSSDSDSDDVEMLLEAWWAACGSKPISAKGDDKAPGLIELALADDLSLPVRKEVNADGDRVYSPRSFGEFLGKYKSRVFELEDGTQVSLQRVEGKRTRRGALWQLAVVNRKTPTKSNVGGGA